MVIGNFFNICVQGMRSRSIFKYSRFLSYIFSISNFPSGLMSKEYCLWISWMQSCIENSFGTKNIYNYSLSMLSRFNKKLQTLIAWDINCRLSDLLLSLFLFWFICNLLKWVGITFIIFQRFSLFLQEIRVSFWKHWYQFFLRMYLYLSRLDFLSILIKSETNSHINILIINIAYLQ